MIRKIIHIDQEKCNGCGACAAACHEGAIEMLDGKATLTREDYCDGLGDCLPACPADAISFEPDVISILIGINDIWHRYEKNKIATTDAQFELNYRCILERILVLKFRFVNMRIPLEHRHVGL